MTWQSTFPRGLWLVMILAWGVFLLIMYQTGLLARTFQTEPYNHFTGAAGVVLFVLALKAALWPAHHQAEGGCHCGCDHQEADHDHDEAHDEHEAHGCCAASDEETEATAQGQDARATRRWWPVTKATLVVFVFALPLLVAIFVPSRSLGLNSLAAQRRGISMDPQQVLSAYRSQQKRIAEMEGAYQKLTQLEIIDRVYAQADPAAEPLKVSTVGLVSRRGGVPEGLFRCIRFKMACCAADAMPIEVLVRWPQAAALDEDSWAKVLGTAKREMIDGRPAVVITADVVQPIETPSRPYI